MFLVLLKKEIKQFVRSKAELFMMFVFPIILITTLGIGLKGMMGGQNGFFLPQDEIEVYYSIEEGSKFKDGFISFMEGSKDFINVSYKEKDISEGKEEVDSYNVLLHISLNETGFEIYTSKNGEKMDSKIFRGIFEGMINQYAAYGTIGEFNPQAFLDLKEVGYDEYVVEGDNSSIKPITSTEYYTFAELALIILFVSITVGESVYKENALTTINRVRLSKVREVEVIASKTALGVVIAIIQTILVYLYSTFVLGVNWGEHTLKFMALFIVFGLFASVFGVIFGLMAKKGTTVSGGLNVVITILCLLGGSYTPIQVISSMPGMNMLMYLSPIYWINVATSSTLSGLNTNAYSIAILIPVVFSCILIGIYLLVFRKKGEILDA